MKILLNKSSNDKSPWTHLHKRKNLLNKSSKGKISRRNLQRTNHHKQNLKKKRKKERDKSPEHKSSKKINLLSKSSSRSLRSNMNFFLLQRNSRISDWAEYSSQLPQVQIKIEKPLGRLQFQIKIEKPLNCLKFRDREASWLPSIPIKIEKHLDHPQF